MRSANRYRNSAVQAIIDHIDPPKVGAEIGVYRGGLTNHLLKNVPSLAHLILVDPWKEWEAGERYHDAGHRLVAENQEENYQMAVAAINSALGPDWGNKITISRMLSLEAAALVPDGTLDFVFIDADHSYEGCMEDLHAWYPKVRSGGLFMGHDYGSRKWGVKRAVNEFAEAKKLGVQVYPKSVWAATV